MSNSIELKRNEPYLFRLKENICGTEPKFSTCGQILLSKDSLIVEFRCAYRSINAYGKRYNDLLYNGDIVEVLMMTNVFGKYLEIEVNPNNAQYLVEITNNGDSIEIEKLSNKLYQSFVKIEESEVQYTIEIDLAELKCLNVDITQTTFNLHRQQTIDNNGNMELSALSPTMKPRFHIMEAFCGIKIIN